MNKKLVSFGIMICMSVITIPESFACSCASDYPIDDRINETDIIFKGKLIEKYENLNFRGFIFEIDKLWKNNSDKILLEQKNITVFSELSESACGVDYTLGMNYLIYADMRGKLPYTGLCSSSEMIWMNVNNEKLLNNYLEYNPLDEYGKSPIVKGGSYELLDQDGKPVCLGGQGDKECPVDEIPGHPDSYIVDSTTGDGYSYFPMIFVAIGVVIFSLYIWKKRE